MPVDIAELIRKKSAQLIEYCVELERTLAGADESRRRAVERLFQVIVETISDLGATIAEGINIKSPGSTREAIAIMREEKIYPQEEAFRFEQRYVSIRNRIVHDYEEIDFRLIESRTRNLIDDTRAILKLINQKLNDGSITVEPSAESRIQPKNS